LEVFVGYKEEDGGLRLVGGIVKINKENKQDASKEAKWGILLFCQLELHCILKPSSFSSRHNKLANYVFNTKLPLSSIANSTQNLFDFHPTKLSIPSPFSLLIISITLPPNFPNIQTVCFFSNFTKYQY
jgi:hypothetical protein